MIAVVVAGVAALVSAAFSADLARQFLLRHRPHAAVWTVSLALFSLASAMVSIGLATGWSQVVYGLFWFAGALVTVPLLAVGQLLLLDPRRGRVYLGAAVVAVMASALAVTVSPMDAGALAAADARAGIPIGREVWGSSPATTLLTPLNWSGLIVVAGCVWSVIRHRRPGVLLIALGVLVAGASFGFVRTGNPSVFTITLASGVTIMYLGFRFATPKSTVAAPGATKAVAPTDKVSRDA